MEKGKTTFTVEKPGKHNGPGDQGNIISDVMLRARSLEEM